MPRRGVIRGLPWAWADPRPGEGGVSLVEYAVASGPALIVNVYSRHQANVVAEKRRRLGNAATVLCREDRSEPWRPVDPGSPAPTLIGEVAAIEAALPDLAARRDAKDLRNRGGDGRFAADDRS